MEKWMKTAIPVIAILLVIAVVGLSVSILSLRSELQAVTEQYNSAVAESESLSEQLLAAQDQIQTAVTVDEGDGPSVVAIVNGTEILSDEPMAQYEDLSSMYESYGLGDEETLAQLKIDIVNGYVQDMVAAEKAHELGLHEYTDEELAQIDQEAADAYEAEIASYIEYFATEGQTEQETRQAVIEQMETDGYTLEAVKQTLLENKASDKLYDYATANVTLTDEALKSYYDERVAADQAAYAESTLDFEYAMMDGSLVTYVPEGFRTVKHILIMYAEDQALELSELNTELADVNAAVEAGGDDLPEKTARKQEIEAEIQTIQATLQAKVDEVLAKIAAGEDFDALIVQYGEDAGMLEEPAKTQGYYVSADSQLWDPGFTETCMALSKVGDISQPLWSADGVQIIQYVSDVTPGVVSLDSVHDQLAEEALSTMKEETYYQALEGWVAASNVEYFYENMK